MLRNIFRNNINEELTVVRKTERDNETYKFVNELDVVEVLKAIILRALFA